MARGKKKRAEEMGARKRQKSPMAFTSFGIISKFYMYMYIFLLLKKVGDCVVCTTCMVRVKGDEAKTLMTFPLWSKRKVSLAKKLL